jgi:hypothetical protein
VIDELEAQERGQELLHAAVPVTFVFVWCWLVGWLVGWLGTSARHATPIVCPTTFGWLDRGATVMIGRVEAK